MNVFHHHLEPVEASSLWDLDLSHESLGKVLENNTVGSSEKGQNVLDEMPFIIGKLYPVSDIFSKINFFSGPEACHLFFVHLPDVLVLNWQNNESVWVFSQKWFVKWLLGLGELGLTLLSNYWILWHLGIKSAMLAVVLVHQLGAELGDDAWLLEVFSSLTLALRHMEFDMLLTLLVLGVLRKNFCNFLLMCVVHFVFCLN